MEMIRSILRILQFLWVLLTTALIGNAIATNGGNVGNTALNFVMFVCALSWIAVLYGVAMHFVSAIAVPIVTLVLDGLAVLFTLIAAIALAAKLGAVNCSNLGGKDPGYIAFGSWDDEKRCRQIQASTVFLWFLFVAFVGTLFYVFKDYRRGGSSIRRGPNMSQIGV
ncbi:hypothetical protein DL766_000590 [Monosporascus sp. MC13-8B]|uniref:MARVEL domain-containing protein n=1 Tax=Monosporascus cannonballus TaxID=155416 RepID=A0ABY0HJ82_9PEZI|nr:hypothetical protein DL762_000637 [Monosporascus cannonballus]RYP01418.1 hypothetical protein DL763_000228 [Monosporascus cannonballus]RYP39048.1 hypothetical protein DL766_000590 [Monosporascus sp. MC13-8B]